MTAPSTPTSNGSWPTGCTPPPSSTTQAICRSCPKPRRSPTSSCRPQKCSQASAGDAAAPVPDTGNLRSDLIAGLDDVRQLLSSALGTVLLDVAWSRDDDLDEFRQTYWRARLDQCSAIVERAVARGELPAGTDHRLVFELLIGPVHARILLSPDSLEDVETTTIVDAVLNGVAKPV